MGSTGNGGSVGVYTGRMTVSQLGSLLSGRGQVSVEGKIPARIFVDNESGRGGVTIDMTSVGQAKRERFLSALRGRMNTDNSQRAYDRVYAQQRGLNHNEAVSSAQAEYAREQVYRRTLQGVIDRRPEFSGIKIRSRITNRNRPAR